MEKTRLAFLYERKEQTFENLRDLNFEYKAGKLSDADFSTMRDSMEQEAANILAEIEQIEQETGNLREVISLMQRVTQRIRTASILFFAGCSRSRLRRPLPTP